MSLKINVENALADVSIVGNFSLLLMELLTALPFCKVYFIFFKRRVKILNPLIVVSRPGRAETNVGIENGKMDASSPVATATKCSGICYDISSSTKT